jgi:hypothetical protein
MNKNDQESLKLIIADLGKVIDELVTFRANTDSAEFKNKGIKVISSLIAESELLSSYTNIKEEKRAYIQESLNALRGDMKRYD